jgi:hypothetical protein
MLLQAQENALVVLTRASLTDIYDVISGIVGSAEQKIDPALLQDIHVLALFKLRAWDLVCHACPVCERDFYAAGRIAVHQEQIY